MKYLVLHNLVFFMTFVSFYLPKLWFVYLKLLKYKCLLNELSEGHSTVVLWFLHLEK